MHVTSGLWDCKTCGKKGNLLSLKKQLGDTYAVSGPSIGSRKNNNSNTKSMKGGKRKPPPDMIKAFSERLWDDEKARPVRDYLIEQRGLCEDVLRRYQVGAVRRHGKWWVSLVAFGTDLLSLVQYGFENVVTGTAGATQGWPDEWIRDAKKHKTVYVALDAGEVGEAGSLKLAKSIGIAKCIRVRPPGIHKDWNECLAAKVSTEDVNDAFYEGGEAYKPDGVRQISDYRAELRSLRLDPEGTRGFSTGWTPLDDLWGGIRPAEITVLTGDTASGKTSFAAAIAHNVSRIHGWPVLFAPLETRGISVVKKWACIEADDDITDLENLTEEQFDSAFDRLESLPLHVLDHWGAAEVNRVADTIRWAAEAEGVKFVVIDHLHYLLGVIRENERHALDEAMKTLNLVAQDTGTHILVIVHPRNIENDGMKIQMAHLKGSSGIKQEAHNILSLWRKRKADRKKTGKDDNHTVVTVLKVRSEAGDEGRVVFDYDRASCFYREIKKGFQVPKVEEDNDKDEPWWNK